MLVKCITVPVDSIFILSKKTKKDHQFSSAFEVKGSEWECGRLKERLSQSD